MMGLPISYFRHRTSSRN